MEIIFEKYQGAGNDFVLIDQRKQQYIVHNDERTIAHLCDRRFGIGADGLILLEASEKNDFKMVYFNADGRESTMCGNGGRCIVQFAHQLHIFEESTVFDAIDGTHQAKVNKDGTVSLQMIDVENVIKLSDNTYQLNTGSPHYISFCEFIPNDVKQAGSIIRYSPIYKDEGINVNFVKKISLPIEIATYERGVEDETYSCGTGVTAAAIAYAVQNDVYGHIEYSVITKGGNLKVSFEHKSGGIFSDVWLIGPAVKTFNGFFKL